MYVKWIVLKPEIPNFSFSRDSNNDGIPDGWTGNPDKCFLTTEVGYPHCLDIYKDFLTSDQFTSGGEITIAFNYKFVGTQYPASFSIRYGDYYRIIQRGNELEDFDWKFFREDITINAGVALYLDSSGCHIRIDNLVIASKYQYSEFKVNPSLLDLSYRNKEEKIITANDELFSIQPITLFYDLENIRASFVYCDKEQLDYLKSLKNERIAIITHDNRIWACMIKDLDVEYIEHEYSQCQHYSVTVSLEGI